MTGKDVCLLKDIPEDVYNEMASEQVATICRDGVLAPVRVVLKVLDIIMHDGNRPDSCEHVARTSFGKLTSLTNEMESMNDRNKTAAKTDDASVPEYLWDASLIPDLIQKGGRHWCISDL